MWRIASIYNFISLRCFFWTHHILIFPDHEMMHKAWCSTEELPYCFSKSSIKFQGQNRQFFLSRVTLKFDGQPWNSNRLPLLCYFNLSTSFRRHRPIQAGVTVWKRPIWVKISDFLPPPPPPRDLEIWQMTLKNNRAHLLYFTKLCESFHSQWSIKAGVTVRKRLIWVEIGDFLSLVTLKFDGWPWKTIDHLLYATSSFSHHFIAIGQFKLKLQPWNAKFRSKSAILCPPDLEIWQMTLKNNRAPLLCYFKLCAWFHCHMWIQTGVTVRKRLS